jgi:hypothetical protein
MSQKIQKDGSEPTLDDVGSTGPSEIDTAKTLDDGVLDEDRDVYASGIKMRDLGEDEVHQFPGLKRERWW